MGRRKAKARVMRKPRPKVDKVFDCPFCNHTKSVECAINRKTFKARIKCRVCDATHETDEITHLSEPIDVYSEWIDLCEELNRRHLESGIGGGAAAVMGVSNRPAPGLAIPGLPGDGSAADGMMMMNFDAQQERDSDLDDFVVDDLAHLDSDLEDEKSGAEGGRGKEGRNGDVKREPGVEVTQEGQPKRRRKLRRVKSELDDEDELRAELDALREDEDDEDAQDF